VPGPGHAGRAFWPSIEERREKRERKKEMGGERGLEEEEEG
jgi:hypothetical protein